MKLGLKGFTLLEVLIAIGLLSLLMLMLFSALRTGTRAWDAVDKQSQIQNEQRNDSRI
jgi:general secretion pathway protein J